MSGASVLFAIENFRVGSRRGFMSNTQNTPLRLYCNPKDQASWRSSWEEEENPMDFEESRKKIWTFDGPGHKLRPPA